MAPPFAVLLLFSILILLHRVKPDPSDTEKHTLLAFIKQLKPDNSFNWNPSTSPCSWQGVLCDPTDTTVIQLSLPNAGLTGPIPPGTMRNLPNLLVLSLSGNYLTGNISSDFSYLVLNELYLNNNQLSGYIPYINSDTLDKIDVSNNNLSCRIPSSLYKFPASAFSGNNEFLCGFPLPLCSISQLLSCPFQYRRISEARERSKIKRVTLGVSLGLGIPLLILFCCLRSKMRDKKSKQPRKPSLEAPDIACGNELVWLIKDEVSNGLVWDELVQGSAEVLGRGSLGTTYKRVMEEKKMTVALKRLKDVAAKNTEFELLMEDLGKMKNENVVPLRGYYCSEDEKWMVYDYKHGGSLFAHLHDLRGAQLNWNHRMRIAISVARGVAFLHVGNVVHGNIKSSNVLLQQESNKDASVSDYGLNALFDTWSSPNHWVTGYWAPEVLRNQKFSIKSDVYSFGVLLLELLTRKNPNQALADQNDFPMWVQLTVCDEPKVEIFAIELRKSESMKQMSQMLRIAKDCVSIVPDQRPTMLEVVSMMEDMEMVEAIIES